MGHYLFTLTGTTNTTWTVSSSAGQGTWWLGEVTYAAYDTAVSSNSIGSGHAYATPDITPTAGTRILVGSLASTTSLAAPRTVDAWTNTFTEKADLYYSGADYPMQGVATRMVTATGSTVYSTGVTYSAVSTGRSAILCSLSAVNAADSQPPTSPTGLAAAASGTSEIELTWTTSTDNTGVAGYEYSVDGGTTYFPTGTTASPYTIDGLAPTTTYTIRLRAYDATGNRSPYATATATTDAGAGLRSITHGEELLISDVGPWALQGVANGSEVLQAMTTPARGYWRIDTPSEFAPTSTYVYNNDPTNHGGVVPVGGMVIDGYTVPAGTIVCQFRSFDSDFYAQSQSSKVMFRGCSWRTTTISGSSVINDSYSTTDWQCFMHFCDLGGIDKEHDGGAFWKMLAGSGHRAYRLYMSDGFCGIQPNCHNVEITEIYIAGVLFLYGEAGTSGSGPDVTTGHVNGISTEGAVNGLTIQRCKITIPSPDGATGSTGSAPGQVGYGTQPGQLGYGAGSNPGRIVQQTDCIALFTIQGPNNQIRIVDNYLGGSGYCLYGSDAGSTNNVYTGNKITTQWWTSGASFGPYTGTVAFGNNGNISSGNVWADDYGTSGNGCTAIADRQYPAGNGPRTNTAAF